MPLDHGHCHGLPGDMWLIYLSRELSPAMSKTGQILLPKARRGKKKDNKKPGPCRIVYAQTGSAFCGIMCHESMVQNADDRDFKLCK